MFRKDSLTAQSTVVACAAANPELVPIASGMRQAAEECNHGSSACVIPARLLPELAGRNASVLLVVLPARSPDAMRILLDGDGEVTNVRFDDSLGSATMLRIRGGGSELDLDVDRLLSPPVFHDVEEGFVVVMVSGETVLRRHFVPGDSTDFVNGLQAAQCCSGGNLRPHLVEPFHRSDDSRKQCSVDDDGLSFRPYPLRYKNR